MNVNPYLSFDGNCEQAFKFYVEKLGAIPGEIFRFAGSPMEQHCPEDQRDRVMHGHVKLGDLVIMGADAVGECPYTPLTGFSITINLTDERQSEHFFEVLSEHGEVQMPLQNTFWAKKFGMVKDQFGVPWMIMCE